jgi:Xaa-Pro aminopeptidase
VLRTGSQVNVKLGANRYSYRVGLMRTLRWARLRRAYGESTKPSAGLEAALAVARPGRTCSEVASAFYRTIQKNGYRKDSRCGYSIGINWLESTASLKEGDTTKLQPNMTYHRMLGNWIEEEFGYVNSETLRVTESAPEVMTGTPRTLFELD